MKGRLAPISEFLASLPKTETHAPGYVVRIPFRHSYVWGGGQRVEVLEYWTPTLQPSQGIVADELAKVLESLGYWKNGKPTKSAVSLRDPRNAHVQILVYGTFIAPGPIHSTSDKRFQDLIKEIPDEHNNESSPSNRP
jgi:hypothetical protein